MSTNVCFAYPWATFGGCERVFINRAMAFKRYLPGVKVDFFFLSDGGGLKSFDAALKKYCLQDVASITTSIDRSYDLVSLVDCPQLFNKLNSNKQKYIVECHTGYVENRQYLESLPDECSAVVAPTLRFLNLLKCEFPQLSVPFLELSNFVPWDVDEYHLREQIFLPRWTRKPILFFGRMDKLKDPAALLDAFKVLESRRKGEFMLLLCGPRSIEVDIDNEIAKRGLLDIAVVLPPIPFNSASLLLQAVRKAEGLFVSPSRAESFGLSAAEAISVLLPPVLSSIDAHLDLVNGADDLFVFRLGDVNDFASRIESLSNVRSSVSNILCELRNNFSASRFISDWNKMLDEV